MVNKVSLVTGAARGIGLATSKLFISEGYKVVMVDRDADQLLVESERLKGSYPIVCDVSVETEVKNMMGCVQEEMGRLDCIVNNAGVAEFDPIENVDFKKWRRIMSTNLDGVFLCSQFAIPLLKQSKGSIVNIASISGLRASTLRIAYGTSKAAVIQLTKQQAVELGEFSIRSNCVAPGRAAFKYWPHTQAAGLSSQLMLSRCYMLSIYDQSPNFMHLYFVRVRSCKLCIRGKEDCRAGF